VADEIRLPQLGMTMKEATVVAWLKREGESVAQGEPLVQVETDKAVSEVEAPASGVLTRIVAPAGSVVPVGAVIATLG
jgi:pyruvate/2-oxoglutarate dehydrogenase complex dihydrolipoamide acyltransferase (E2) component